MGVYIASYVAITVLFLLLTNYTFRVRVPAYGDGRQEKGSGRQEKFFVACSCALLIFVVGFRAEYQGIDLHNALGTGYFYVYDIICEDSVADIFRYFSVKRYANFEIGFVLFNKFLSFLCDRHQTLLLGCSLVSIAPVGYYISRNSRNALLSMLLYLAMPFFTSAYFSAIRQGIAIGIVVFSYDLVRRRKLLPFLAAILLAATFHKSAVVCLIAYPAYHLRISRKDSIVLGVGVLALIYVVRMPLFTILSKLLRDSSLVDNNGAINYFLFLTAVYTLCAVFCNEEDREMCGLRNLLWLGCASQAFAGLFSTAGRITWYFLPSLLVLVPNLLRDVRVKEKQLPMLFTWGIGGLAVLAGLYYFRYDAISAAYPYVPFWREW